MTKSTFRLLAVVPPGLEDVTLGEIKSMFDSGKKVKGGVLFSGDISTLMKANLHLRTATRILLTLGRFEVKDFKTLIHRTSRYPWEIYCAEGVPLKIRVTSRHSRLWHSDAVKERLIKGIEKRLGYTPCLYSKKDDKKQYEYQLLICRIKNDVCTLEVDSSGDFLFKRGYKVSKGLAPLRENFAAALLIASGWDRKAPLLDPFCGTGTIPIEAALMRRNIPPGANKSFSFFRWRIFDPSLWEALLSKAMSQVKSEKLEPVIYARDRDPSMVEATRENAINAGVLDDLIIERLSFEASSPPSAKPGWIVTNPPYGQRLREGTATGFLRAIKKRIEKVYRDWNAFCLFPRISGFQRVLEFYHGGIKVSLLRLS